MDLSNGTQGNLMGTVEGQWDLVQSFPIDNVRFYIKMKILMIGNEDSSMIRMIEIEDSSVENDDFYAGSLHWR